MTRFAVIVLYLLSALSTPAFTGDDVWKDVPLDSVEIIDATTGWVRTNSAEWEAIKDPNSTIAVETWDVNPR